MPALCSQTLICYHLETKLKSERGWVEYSWPEQCTQIEKRFLLVFNPQKNIMMSGGLGIPCCPSDKCQNVRAGILWHHRLLCTRYYCVCHTVLSHSGLVVVGGGWEDWTTTADFDQAYFYLLVLLNYFGNSDCFWQILSVLSRSPYFVKV